MGNIDFVIYWVDGSDPEWQKKKSLFNPSKGTDSSSGRYRDLETLKYLFRGIEKYASWVNNVYLITDNQKPSWLNINNPKLRLINHEDYIPKENLPVFSSHPIELCLHNIEGLSENFVVFNDDCLILNNVKETDFFIDGKPVDILTEFPLQYKVNRVFNRILFNDFTLMSKYFPSRNEYKKRLRSKILSPKYGAYFFYNLLMYMLPYKAIFGITTPHFARPYRKQDFKSLWEKEPELLNETISHRFRSEDDINIYAIRFYNLLKGDFVPGNIFKIGHAFDVYDDNESVYKAIKNQKYRLVCISDNCNDEVFDVIKPKILSACDSVLGEKSSFEV